MNLLQYVYKILLILTYCIDVHKNRVKSVKYNKFWYNPRPQNFPLSRPLFPRLPPPLSPAPSPPSPAPFTPVPRPLIPVSPSPLDPFRKFVETFQGPKLTCSLCNVCWYTQKKSKACFLTFHNLLLSNLDEYFQQVTFFKYFFHIFPGKQDLIFLADWRQFARNVKFYLPVL